MLSQTNAKIVIGGSQEIGNGEYLVKVIDYDGTLIDMKCLDNGEEYTLPSAPSHTGLVFQEWSCTQEIINGKITIDKNDVLIGPIYTTESGQNEFDIELTNKTGLNVYLKMSGTKDWGDGTIDTDTYHSYTQVGKYTIKCDGNTLDGSYSITSMLFNQNGSAGPYNNYVTAVRIATIETLKGYTFAYCNNLKTITFSNKVKYVEDYSVKTNQLLKAVILPTSITSAPVSNFIVNCYALKSYLIPYGFTFIGASGSAIADGCYEMIDFVVPKDLSLTGVAETQIYIGYANQKTLFCPSWLSYFYISRDPSRIEKVVFSKNKTSFANNFMSSFLSIIVFDFSSHEEIPTLAGSFGGSLADGANRGFNWLCKIKVPSALEAQWKTASNWSNYSQYIVGV